MLQVLLLSLSAVVGGGLAWLLMPSPNGPHMRDLRKDVEPP